MRGYIVKDDKEQIWLQDREGTWVVKKEDIQITGEWEGVDPRFEGKPVCIFIRDGAEIYEVKPTTISLSSRPITLSDPRTLPKVEGDQLLKELAEGWARHLGFTPWESARASTPGVSGSCWMTGDMGVDCEADDSRPD